MSHLAHRRPDVGGLASRARRGDGGSVLLMVAISLSVIVTCTALTVDLGRVSTLRRDLQNVADAAALDLVRLVDGRTAGEIATDPAWAATRAASLERNGFVVDGDASATVRLGAYDAAGEVFTPVASADQVPSAVEVVVADRVDHQFAPGSTATNRSAVGAQTAVAGIQVGSFVARLDSSQSALLGALVGDVLGVELVGHEGLAGARVGLAVLAAELDLSIGSPEQLLATELTVVELIEAQARVLEAGGQLAQADALRAIGLSLPTPDAPITLGDLVTIAPGGSTAAAVASLDVLELLAATAFAVQPEHGFLDVPTLDLGIPGVVATTTSVRVTQAPQIAFGGPGASVRTSQVALRSTVELDVAGLTDAALTLEVDVADSTATIRDLTCGTSSRLDVEVATGLVDVVAGLDATIHITPTPPLSSALGLDEIPVADVTVEGAAGQSEQATLLAFDLPPDELGVAKPTSIPTISIADLDAEADVTILPSVPVLGPTLEPVLEDTVDDVVASVVTPLFHQVLAALDDALVQPLLALLGISLPGADVTPLVLRCSGARLVA